MNPLHDLKPTTRFSDRVGDYVRYRPSYPAEAIDRILAGFGPAERLIAADVGAGTGISARLLADRGVRVIAVEPNADMRAGAEPHPRVEWRDGTAESTGLPDRSVDLVLCAQAFHWFRPVEALTEFARILKPGARLALMWNQRDVRDPFTAAYRQAILDCGGESVVELVDPDPFVIDRHPAFEPHQTFETSHAQRLDEAGLLGRATSASYVPKTGPMAKLLVAKLRGLFARSSDAEGLVTLHYVTRVYIARRR
jgi:SAM-dependent methyltransferase